MLNRQSKLQQCVDALVRSFSGDIQLAEAARALTDTPNMLLKVRAQYMHYIKRVLDEQVCDRKCLDLPRTLPIMASGVQDNRNEDLRRVRAKTSLVAEI